MSYGVRNHTITTMPNTIAATIPNCTRAFCERLRSSCLIASFTAAVICFWSMPKPYHAQTVAAIRTGVEHGC